MARICLPASGMQRDELPCAVRLGADRHVPSAHAGRHIQARPGIVVFPVYLGMEQLVQPLQRPQLPGMRVPGELQRGDLPLELGIVVGLVIRDEQCYARIEVHQLGPVLPRIDAEVLLAQQDQVGVHLDELIGQDDDAGTLDSIQELLVGICAAPD